MLNVVIVEDERPSLELMKMMISKNDYLNVVAAFNKPREVLECIDQLQADVFFIDVEMPGMNGIELANEILKFNEDIQIVFVTAYSDYAVDAFKVNAVNYVLKPLTDIEINTTVQRLLKISSQFLKKSERINPQHRVYCFGRFEMYQKDNNKLVKWPTAKTEELFAYFIYRHEEKIEKWTLCEMFWPNSQPEKAEHNLHNTVYRLKKTLKSIGIKDMINYSQGGYYAKFKDIYCDVFDLETFIKNNKQIDQINVNEFEKRLSLYNGNIFEGKDYLWSSTWSESLILHYIELVKKLAEYYMKAEQYRKAEMKLREMLQIYPLDEQAYEMLFEIYFYMKDRIRLIKSYHQLRTVLKKELNMGVQEGTKKLYTDLISQMAT